MLMAAHEKHFDFPSWNCLYFALQDIDAMLETEFYNKYANLADSPQTAAKNLRRMEEVKTPKELILKLVGGELQHISAARIGDIVFIDEMREDWPVSQVDLFGPTPGVCYGMNSWFVGENGLVQIPTLKLDSAVWVS